MDFLGMMTDIDVLVYFLDCLEHELVDFGLNDLSDYEMTSALRKFLNFLGLFGASQMLTLLMSILIKRSITTKN